MGYSEFLQWIAYLNAEPVGGARGDTQAAMICATIANSNRRKGTKARKVGDFMNALKASKEFGLIPQMKPVALMVFANEIEALGLKQTQGLMFTDSWFWDRTPEARKWTDRFFAKTKKMPTSLQASDYSSAMAWFQAVERAKTLDADKVMAELKAKPLNDMFGKGTIQPNGRYAHDMYLLQVKSPQEAKGPHDFIKHLQTMPASEVWATKEEAKCPIWK